MIRNKPPRNHKTHPTELTCPYYHPLYCVKKGYTYCRFALCDMKGKTKEELDEATKIILDNLVSVGLSRVAQKSGFTLVTIVIYSKSFHSFECLFINIMLY